MGTRANIGIIYPDNSVKVIYSNYDNYLSGTGITLIHNYYTKEQVEQLISLGELMAVEETIEKTKANSFHIVHNEDIQIDEYDDLSQVPVRWLADTDREYHYFFHTVHNCWGVAWYPKVRLNVLDLKPLVKTLALDLCSKTILHYPYLIYTKLHLIIQSYLMEVYSCYNDKLNELSVLSSYIEKLLPKLLHLNENEELDQITLSAFVKESINIYNTFMQNNPYLNKPINYCFEGSNCSVAIHAYWNTIHLILHNLEIAVKNQAIPMNVLDVGIAGENTKDYNQHFYFTELNNLEHDCLKLETYMGKGDK